MAEQSGRQKWVLFICGVVCIAAVGVSGHFIERGRKERERRASAEDKLRTAVSELQLLKEKNLELAEQLRDARRIADELAKEKEQLRMTVAEGPLEGEAPRIEAPPEKVVASSQEKGEGSGEVVGSLLSKKLALAGDNVRNAASARWRVFWTPLATSLRSAIPQRAEASAKSPERRDIPGSFAVSALARVGAQAQRVARDAVRQMRSIVSFEGKTPPVSASVNVPAPAESPKKLTATNEELREELAQVREEKRELERQIAERTGRIDGAVDVGQVIITTGRRFSGKVLVVNQKHNFVVIDIGKNQGLEKEEVLIVHRRNKFVGKAQVIKLYEKMAAADLIMDWMQDEVQVNDGVKKF